MVHKLVAEDEILMLPCMAQPRVRPIAGNLSPAKPNMAIGTQIRQFSK